MTRPLRIVQVTDTHLSRTHAYFVDNWRVFVEDMRADPPDLIVHTGDLTLRGSDGADDLIFARGELDRLPAPVLAVPGNHDIGDTPPDPRLGRPIDDERRARWLSCVGPEWGYRDLGGDDGWRIIGIDAQLFDSGFAAEREQFDWLRDALRGRGRRRAALFLHKPLFYRSADDGDLGLSCLYPGGRARLIDLCRDADVRLVGSGHLHVYRTLALGQAQLVWSPATAFINTKEKKLPPVEGLQRRPGYIRYVLDGDAVGHRFVEPDLFIGHDVRNWSIATGSTVFLPPRPLAGAGT